MATWIVPNGGEKSGRIDEAEANEMKGRFIENFKKYEIPSDTFFKILNRVSNVDPEGYSVALSIRPGRNRRYSIFNIAIEAIRYRRDKDGSIAGYRSLSENEYFCYISIDNFGDVIETPGQDYVNGKIYYKDEVTKPPLEIIVVELNVLKEFCGEEGECDFFWLEFARHQTEQLTIIFTRRNKFGNVVTLKNKTVTGFFLDQHDLIPPPPEEE